LPPAHETPMIWRFKRRTPEAIAKGRACRGRPEAVQILIQLRRLRRQRRSVRLAGLSIAPPPAPSRPPRRDPLALPLIEDFGAARFPSGTRLSRPGRSGNEWIPARRPGRRRGGRWFLIKTFSADRDAVPPFPRRRHAAIPRPLLKRLPGPRAGIHWPCRLSKTSAQDAARAACPCSQQAALEMSGSRLGGGESAGRAMVPDQSRQCRQGRCPPPFLPQTPCSYTPASPQTPSRPPSRDPLALPLVEDIGSGRCPSRMPLRGSGRSGNEWIPARRRGRRR